MPERIQLRRIKGWRMPRGVVKVDRTTRWGNPFKVIGGDGRSWEVFWHTGGKMGGPCMSKHRTKDAALAAAVHHHRAHLLAPEGELMRRQIKAELAGKGLACWCKPGAPCHADTLLEIANG